VHLLPELAENGMIITHASVLVRNNFEYNREFHVVRFHLYHQSVAQPHEGMDTFKLAEAFDEICAMGYWRVHAHRNNGEQGSWLSLNADGRTQRYTAEDTERPVVAYKRDELGDKVGEAKPLVADHELHYSNSGFELK
jgi:hypothetical protein